MVKKKGKKKSKKSKKTDDEPKDDDAPKEVNEKPIFRHPIKDAPIATIKVQLANPLTSMIVGDFKMRTSMKLYSLQQKIKELHGGSIENIRVGLSGYIDDQAYTDPTMTLRDMGMATEGPFNLFYDFDVKPRPLLKTPLNYKILGEDPARQQ